MGKKFEPTPEMKAKIEEIRGKLDHEEMNPLDLDDLDVVSGGGALDRIPLDPNKEINGWTYTDLREMLYWIYNAYTGPGREQQLDAQMVTMYFAEDCVQSVLWRKYIGYPYPTFIEEPLYRIWCPTEAGVI